MFHEILESAALGIAGFDPVGLVVLLGAMALGATKRSVLALMLTTVSLTFALGFLPVLVAGSAITGLLRSMHRINHETWAALTLALGIGLLVEGARRWVGRKNGPEKKSERAPRSITPLGLTAAGALVALSALVDPAFYGIVLFASDQSSRATGGVSVLVWTLCSHSALLIVGSAALTGLYAPVERALTAFRQRWSAHAPLAITTALLVSGVVAVVEGVAKWNGHWLMFSH